MIDKIANNFIFIYERFERRYKKVNVWKRPTQYLIDIIGSSGTFQMGHYDNKHLEIYEYNGYIRGRHRSPT